MQAFVPCAAGLLLLISVYLLSTSLTTPKLKKRPLPLEDLQQRSLQDLHNDLVRGSMKMEVPIKKDPETSWNVPTRAHFIWIGSLIREKYVNNINNFCNHNPEYQVAYSKIYKSDLHKKTTFTTTTTKEIPAVIYLSPLGVALA